MFHQMIVFICVIFVWKFIPNNGEMHWDDYDDRFVGNVTEISPGEIDHDSFQLIFMYYTEDEERDGHAWCHGSVIHINHDKQAMHLLSDKHCAQQMKYAYITESECEQLFPSKYYYPLILLFAFLWAGAFWLVFLVCFLILVFIR